MKLQHFGILYVVFILACSASAMPGYVDPAASADSSSENKPLLAAPQATRTPEPTATIDYQATLSVAYTAVEDERQNAYQAQQAALDAQETSIAANVLIVGYTAQADANTMIAVGITESSAQRAETHVYETQTAQPTALAATKTQTVIDLQKLSVQSGELTATSPEGIKAKSDAEYSAKFGWVNYMAVGLVSITMFLLFVWVVIYLNERSKERAVAANDEDEPYIIPMAENVDNPNQTLRAEIQCTAEQLVLLAKGWMQDKKTPAFNKWRGTVVINALYEIREFLTLHKLAYELDGKRGELAYTERGRAFMEYTAINGEPPTPFVCVLYPLPSHEESPKNTPIPLTGVPGRLS